MLKKIFRTVRDFVINPYAGLITKREFNRIKKLPRFQENETQLFGNTIKFSDNYGFLCSLKEILVDKQNQFNSSNSKPLIVDCGSNIGFTLIDFKRQYPDARIIAFEPDNQIFNILQQNVNAFHLSNVELNKAAIWNEDTELDFFSDGSLAGTLEQSVNKENTSNLVKAVRLKNIMQNKQVDFLKMDIEGAESRVIFDIADELKSVKKLFLEYHSIVGQGQVLGKILDVITGAGFRYYIKNHNDNFRYPFKDNAPEGFDMQLSIFCYRQ